MSTIRFDGRVAVVTGAGNGLGRSHALELARRGAKVVINDLGGALDGTGRSDSPAEKVCDEIEAGGGEALAHGGSVTDPEAMKDLVGVAMARWGRIDILVNNAGILRDKSFAKTTLEDFRAVLDVHLMGSFICTQAVWPIMKARGYGRVVFTTSASGMYGNFGQASYGAAKMGVLGLMNTLCIEGQKHGIRVNALSPSATTRMTESLPGYAAVSALMSPESVTAGLVALVAEDAPHRLILCAGAGVYAAGRIYESDGLALAPSEQTPEQILHRLEEVVDPEGQVMPSDALQQTMKLVQKALQGPAQSDG